MEALDDSIEEKERKSVPVQWVLDLDPDEKKAFLQDLANSGFVLDKLKQIIRSRYRATKPKLSDYQSPSWAYLQADQNGYRRALEDMLNILP